MIGHKGRLFTWWTAIALGVVFLVGSAGYVQQHVNQPDPARCEAALRLAASGQAHIDALPPECDGLSTDQLNAIADKLVMDYLNQ